MKNYRSLIAFQLWAVMLISLVAVNGCRNQSGNKAATFSAEVHLTALPNQQMILHEVKPDGFVAIDTSSTDGEGKGHFVIEQTEPGIYFITLNDKRIIVLSVPGEKVSFRSTSTNLSDLQTEGSDQNKHLQQYLSAFDEQRKEIDSLSVRLDQTKDRNDYPRIRDSIGLRYSEIFANQQELTINYLKSNLTSLGTLIALNQRSGPRSLLTVDEHFDLMQTVDSSLRSHYSNNKHVAFLHESIMQHIAKLKEKAGQNQRLQPGNLAPEIILNGANNETFKLSSLRGKVVVLHFWASWAPNYRDDFPVLQRITQHYGTFNFDLISISFDNKRYQWMQALQTDFIQWTQLADMLYPNSPLQKLYNVGDKLPTYFIIDKEGLIVGRFESVVEVAKALKNMEM